jgi:hypothetical protein
MIACFILAGLMTFQRIDSGITLASRQTAPATTGLATLVPERLLHPEFILDPIISLPYATISGFTLPYLNHRNPEASSTKNNKKCIQPGK